MAKLRSMTETIKMLSTENVALREENDGLSKDNELEERKRVESRNFII